MWLLIVCGYYVVIRISHNAQQKKGAKEFAPPGARVHPTNGPFPSKSGAKSRRMNMPSLSHSKKNPSTVTPPGTPPGLSGPDALRAYFAPRQVLRLKEAALCLNYSYSHFFRRIQSGTLDLKIRKNEVGERFVLLDDLISYIYPPSEESPSSPLPAKRKVGRPRKTEGGAK